MNQNNNYLHYFKEKGLLTKIPLNQLREFQEFEKGLDQLMKSYEESLPDYAAYAMKSFHTIQMFCIALMSESHMQVRRCYEDVMSLFGDDEAFNDGITVPSWIFYNFPISPSSNETIASIAMKNLNPEILQEISPFLFTILKSRLGLYEIIQTKKNQCLVKELFTDREIILDQVQDDFPKGSICLFRIINLFDKNYFFGDPHFWPASKKEQIKTMIEDKMEIYFFNNNSIIDSYETMMRVAGPYWFSITAIDYDDDIINPDYYLKFYTN